MTRPLGIAHDEVMWYFSIPDGSTFGSTAASHSDAGSSLLEPEWVAANAGPAAASQAFG